MKSLNEQVREHANMIFPSKEDDGIEHVDESYEGYMAYFKQALLTTEKRERERCIGIVEELGYVGANNEEYGVTKEIQILGSYQQEWAREAVEAITNLTKE